MGPFCLSSFSQSLRIFIKSQTSKITGCCIMLNPSHLRKRNHFRESCRAKGCSKKVLTRQGISRISAVNSMQEQPIGSISDRWVTKALSSLKWRNYYTITAELRNEALIALLLKLVFQSCNLRLYLQNINSLNLRHWKDFDKGDV